MSTENVQYVLSLKDMFSHVLEEAHKKVEEFEHTFEKVGEITREWGHALLGLAGIAEGFEFLKGTVEAFSEAEDQVAQLKAGIESTGGAAGITLEEMTKQATEFADTLPYAKAEIMNVQAQLLTFPSITKQTFTAATQAILDISSRTHHSTQELSIMIGKALQNPVMGIMALRRIGANFTAEQTELIKKMVAAGQSAKAQQFILHELATEYGGSAAKAAETLTGQASILSSEFEEQREKVGELIAQGFMALKPVLSDIIEAFGAVVDKIKEAVEWVKEHRDVLNTLKVVVVSIVAAIAAYQVALVAALVWEKLQTLWTLGQVAAMYVLEDAYEGASIVTKVLAAAQYAWNAAMEANPIGLVIAGIIALIGLITYLYNHFAGVRAVIWGVWAALKEFGNMVVDVFKGVYHIIHGALTFNFSEMKDGLMSQVDFYLDAGKRLGTAFKKGYDDGMADFNKDHATSPNEKVETPKPIKAGATTAGATKTPASKVSGQRITTINVTINGGLVHAMTFQTTNIQESTSKIRENVIKALTSAVNDSQIVADQ
jgi:hypothetical protein